MKNLRTILCLIMSFIMCLTVTPIGTVVMADTGEYDYTYYIAPGGKGTKDGLSAENAMSSITKVVNALNKANISNAKVKIVVSGGEGLKSGMIMSNTDSDLPDFQDWPWPSEYCDNIDFLITSADPSNPATLAYGNQGVNISAYGNTIYKDINLIDTDLADRYIYSAGFDLEFDNVEFFFTGFGQNKQIYKHSQSYALDLFAGGTKNDGLFYQASGNTNLATGGTLTIKGPDVQTPYHILAFGGTGTEGKKTTTIPDDVSIVVNGGKVWKLYLQRTECVTTYKGDLNIVLNGASLGSALVSENNTYAPVVEGAIQFVANNGAKLPNMDTVLKYATDNDVTYFIMDSSDAITGSLMTTKTAGSYKVTSNNKYAYAYDAVNNPNTIYYGEDILTVGKSGKYVVGYANNLEDIISAYEGNWYVNTDGTITKDSARIVYYVASGGAGTKDGLSLENAAPSITNVVNKINAAGLTEGQVTIRVAGGEGIKNGDVIDTTTLPPFQNWPWPSKYCGNVEFTITSVNPSNPATLAYGNEGVNISAYGNTIFKDINLIDTDMGDREIYSAGYNLEFNNVNFFFSGRGSGKRVYGQNQSYPLDIYAGGTKNNGLFYQPTDTTLASGGTLTIQGPNVANPYTRLSFGGVGTSDKVTSTIPGDATIIVNGGKIWKAILQRTDCVTTYKGNLNLIINGASVGSFLVSEYKSYVPKIEGAIQIVGNNAAVIPDTTPITDYASANNVPYYILKSGASKSDAITLTEKAGTFNIMEGYLAVATDDKDQTKTYVSEGGVLTLPVGSYTIDMMDATNPYTCDGTKIEVYVPCTIDFDEVNPNIYTAVDKVFIGWKLKSTGEFVSNTTKFNIGDVLEAQYIDCTDDDFGVVTEIRTVGDEALRFIVNVDNSFFNKLPSVVEYGSISMLNTSTRGRDIFLNEAVVWDWKWDEETKSIFTPKNTGDKPVAIKAVNLFESTKDYFKYTLTISDIAKENYVRYYTMRGYIKYIDNNGVERVAYTDHINSSMYHAATITVDNYDSETATDVKAKVQAIIEYCENEGKDAYFAPRPKRKVYDNGDPNYTIYNYGTLSVRDVVINSGKNLSVPISISAMADPHLQHINLRDLEEASPQTLATYRGRGWTSNGASGGYLNNCINYARYSDKTVVIGDIWDYISWGTGEAMQRMLTDKFLPGQLIATLGNHEQTQLLVPDISGLNQDMTRDQMDEILKQYWPNDLYYHSEIVKNKAGEEGAIIVSMMSGWDEFNQRQKESLESDIATAKAKGLPVLLFMHNPIATNNPNGELFYGSYDKNSWATSTNYDYIVDMSIYAGGSNCKKQDATTLSVYDMIVQNYDVIKGVFHGHEHLNMYTEIAAKDINGNYVLDGNGNYVTIPQYGVFSIAEGGGSLLDIVIN